MKRLYTYIVTAILMVSCTVSHPDVPSAFVDDSSMPMLFPDYSEVVLPSNIAAPNFMVEDVEVEEVVAQIDYACGTKIFGKEKKVIIDLEEWQEMRDSSIGQSIKVTLYTKAKSQWRRHPAFEITIAEDAIDPWITYRLIEPSYVNYSHIVLNQRSLSDYDEVTFADNRETLRKGEAQCLNCHSYQNYKPDNMLYHVRGKGGGTMLRYKGETRLMDKMRKDGMISNPVYPAWHPTLPYIAFSTNKTGQLFHTQDPAKVEVQDTESHLVCYDVEKDQMIQIPEEMTELETFPTWTPDGKSIYYTSAHVEENTEAWVGQHYKELHYDIYKRDFNVENCSFGQRELVLDLASKGKSATLPRVSPDGKYLVYAEGEFGCFHIWHKDADIHVLDLETNTEVNLETANSQFAESYPTWSSNGRWIIMASRRDDGNYSRIYISYFDKEGKAHKAFALPQADPEYGKLLMKSYNRPEPVLEQVK